MTVTLVSNATADKASFVYCAEHGLTNMRNGAAVTVVGTMADSTVNGHAAKGSGAAVDSYLSAQINGAVAANQPYAVLLVGTFTTSSDSSKPALWASGSSACRPKIVGNYSSGRKVSASSSYAGVNYVGTVPSDNWTTGSQLSIICGRKDTAGLAGSLNNAATVDGYNDATIRAATMASTDSLYFGGSPVVGGTDTAAAGFAVSMCAFFVGVTPEELRTYIGADPWADKIVTFSTPASFAGDVTLDDASPTGSFNSVPNSSFSGSVTLDDAAPTGSFSRAPGTITSDPLKTNNGTLIASTALDFVCFYDDSTNALVLRKTGVSTDSGGIFTVTDAALTQGTTYRIDWQASTGQRRMPRRAAT